MQAVGHISPCSLTEKKMFVLLMGQFLGFERERLTVHLWATNEGVTLKKRGGRRGGVAGREVPRSANHFSSHLSASLWALTHTDPHLSASDWNSSTRQVPALPSSPSARHTPRGIQNALTPNQWETVKKAKKEREKSPQQHNLDGLTRGEVKRKE